MILTSQNTFWVESAQLVVRRKVLRWWPEDEMVRFHYEGSEEILRLSGGCL